MAPDFNKRLKPDFQRTVQRIFLMGHIPGSKVMFLESFAYMVCLGTGVLNWMRLWPLSSRQAVQTMGSWLLGFWWIYKALPTQGEHFFLRSQGESTVINEDCQETWSIYGGHDFVQNFGLGFICDMNTITPCWCNPCGSGNSKLELGVDAAPFRFGDRRVARAVAGGHRFRWKLDPRSSGSRGPSCIARSQF